MSDIYHILSTLNIHYEKYEHPPVFTVEEAEKYDRGDAVHSKNLFLRNKKGNRHYLVVTAASKQINIKELETKLEEKNLSFASSERLLNYLGLTPGSVSPFGLINDMNKEVQVVVDQDLLRGDKQAFHPNINTATLVISTPDFKKFLECTGNKISYLEI
jgi:Ala-tRNA(Pro) deacylase